MTLKIDSLFIYPIKSCRGIELQQAQLIETGLRHDRHWMLVDADGNFLSQRKLPRMTLINTRIESQVLVCSSDTGELEIPLEQPTRACRQVNIWNDQCQAAVVSSSASRWFSDQLDFDCELVYLPATEQRRVDPDYARNREVVSFADGFPLLVISRESVELLGEKLGRKLSVERFRPNIVTTGSPAHAEDEWKNISIDNIVIDLVKPCSRCVIPSIDPGKASKDAAINRTLADYRRRDGKIVFGMNGLHRGQGSLHKGAKIIITSA